MQKFFKRYWVFFRQKYNNKLLKNLKVQIDKVLHCKIFILFCFFLPYFISEKLLLIKFFLQIDFKGLT